MKIKFTIITVVKNDEKGIIKTMKSVLNQNFGNFEYIVVDGNSTDNTLTNIKKFKARKKIKLIKRKDISYYDSLNFAVKISKGQYIGVLNSGDIFVNDNILNKINNNIVKSTKIFYSNFVFIKNGKIVRIWHHKINKITGLNLFKIPHSTLFLSKDIYKKIGLYNLHYKISSDLDFIIRLSKNYNEIKHLNFNSIFMEFGGLSTSYTTLKLKLKEDFKILIYYYKVNFIFFYFLKIYFKLIDFKFTNLIKAK
tara:strand:+ start:1283 stop:2038 length:756 start_codon:yes stop_codon:yes gene_type:complete